MASLFKTFVSLGTEEISSESFRDELKLINSIAFHSVFLSFFAAVGASFLMPSHALVVGILAGTEMIAKLCVLLLNYLQQFFLAKILFTYITLIIFLFGCWYFGLEINLQYCILSLFFILVIVFRNSNRRDMVLMGSYLIVSTTIVGYLFFFTKPIIRLSSQDIQGGQIVAYALNISMIVMVSVIFFKSSRYRRMATEENLKELAGVSRILETISSNVGDGIYKSKVTGGFVYMNGAFKKLFGISDDHNLLSQDQDRLFSTPEEREEIVDELRQFNTISNRLIQFKRSDASRFWGRLSCTLLTEDGQEFIVGTVSDVTTLQEHEAMLRESENQLREAQRIAKIGNWQLFNASKVLRWSDECIRIHGFSSVQSDFDYREWLDKLQDIDELELNTLMAKAMMTKENVEFHSWFNTPDGSRKYLIYITRYQRSQKIKGGIWYGTVQDFTEQHITEQRILETKQFYESWIDNLPIESVMIDEKKRFMYISESAIPDSKVRNWLVGKTNKDYAELRGLEDDFYLNRDAKLDEVFRTNKPLRWEERMVNREGLDVFHMRFLFPDTIVERGREKRVAIGYSLNINDIKQAEIELRHKNEELDRFVYSISHDLRAPVASILGLTDLIKDANSSSDIDGMLDMQREALMRMDQYIKDVLDYSRNTRLHVQPAEINIDEIIASCIEELRFFHEKDFKIEIDQSLEVTQILSDAVRFRIIVNNLLSNAFKYQDLGKPEGKIKIASELLENGDIQFSVEDNGIGIRDDLKESVWDMFVRGTHESSGSGIGLYILKEAATVLGADVSFESKLGIGSKFKVTFRKLDDINSERLSED